MTNRSRSSYGHAPARRGGAITMWPLVLALALPASVALAQKRHARSPAPAPAAATPAPAQAAEDTAEPGSNPTPAANDATGPSAKPEAAPAPAAPAADSRPAPAAESGTQPDPEVASLQQELAQVMDDLVQARARVALLGKSLFKTRVRVQLDNRAADQIAVRVALFLDGAPIWSGDGSGVRDEKQISVRRRGRAGAARARHRDRAARARDDAYRYTLRNNYHFNVLRERRTDLKLVLDDDSDIAEDFKDDDEGKYDVRTRLEVRAVGLNEE